MVIETFTKSLDTYAASNKSAGFYCLEHDLNSMTVGVAQKLIPLGLARKITIASVPVCQSDAQPYQNSVVPTTTPNAAIAPTTKSTGSNASGTPSTNGASGKTGPTSGAESRVGGARSVVFAIAGAAVAGLLLA
ncbi:hypothetical protein BGX26_000592 [Mortierella sp. AD094]|nr:hypothetical protein BGX26_000592 [Mortierella sp. AD094]